MPAVAVATADEFRQFIAAHCDPDAEQSKSDIRKMSEPVMYAHRHGQHTTSIGYGGIGQIFYQTDGTRLVAACDTAQLMEAFAGGFQEAAQGLENLNPSSEELSSLPSFSVGCVLPGDALVIPAGFMVCEKPVNNHTFGVRCPVHLLDRRALPSLQRINDHFKGTGLGDWHGEALQTQLERQQLNASSRRPIGHCEMYEDWSHGFPPFFSPL